jgi:hypothetical protein
MPEDLKQRRRYKLLDRIFEVGFCSDTACRTVDPVLRHLATSGHPDSVAAVVESQDGFKIVIDGAAVDHCLRIETLAPMVKQALGAAAVNDVQALALHLHAAMLRRNGTALLLPAAPGGGKSCLAAALARASDFAYHTDEITLLERAALKVRGLPAALAVKDGGWPVLEPLYPEIRSLTTHRRADQTVVRYLPPPVQSRDPALDRSYAVRWIVFPRYAPSTPNHIERLARVEALQLVFDECLALRMELTSHTVQELIDWISGIECYTMTFSDIQEAVRLVDGVCGPLAAPDRGEGRLTRASLS